MAKDITQSTTAALTHTSDKNGCEINICCPSWFDKRDNFEVKNAPPHLADLKFSGNDLNYLARVVYAEASGSAAVKDEAIRIREKLAIVHVMYNRLNVPGFDPNNWTKGKFTTFTGVAGAVKKLKGGGLSGTQFESVIGTDGTGTSKFKSTDTPDYEQLNRANCKDFDECFKAIKKFIDEGPQENLDFDNFRAAGNGTPPKGQTAIGRNRFWKMK
jgi:hypothetical protein